MSYKGIEAPFPPSSWYLRIWIQVLPCATRLHRQMLSSRAVQHTHTDHIRHKAYAYSWGKTENMTDRPTACPYSIRTVLELTNRYVKKHDNKAPSSLREIFLYVLCDRCSSNLRKGSGARSSVPHRAAHFVASAVEAQAAATT